jgi:hypothetical protein
MEIDLDGSGTERFSMSQSTESGEDSGPPVAKLQGWILGSDNDADRPVGGLHGSRERRAAEWGSGLGMSDLGYSDRARRR